MGKALKFDRIEYTIEKAMVTIPNIITGLRLILIPVFVFIHYLPYPWASFCVATIFCIAAITDWVDGFLARRLQQTSAFGAFLDPVADKLMVIVALVLLVEMHSSLILTIPAIIIIIREVSISALREWMARVGQEDGVAVCYLGKIKTTVQMTAITILLAFKPGTIDIVVFTAIGLLYVAVILTIWSFVIYFKAAWPYLIRTVDFPSYR